MVRCGGGIHPRLSAAAGRPASIAACKVKASHTSATSNGQSAAFFGVSPSGGRAGSFPFDRLLLRPTSTPPTFASAFLSFYGYYYYSCHCPAGRCHSSLACSLAVSISSRTDRCRWGLNWQKDLDMDGNFSLLFWFSLALRAIFAAIHLHDSIHAPEIPQLNSARLTPRLETLYSDCVN